MAISITCTCGARLEIDAKFAGQTIPCPDCQRPLQIALPAEDAAPRVERPVHGLALTSLILGLVGAFTLVGSIAAIIVGGLATRQIAQAPQRYGGLGLARAGMTAGAVGLLLTVLGLLAGDLLGVDALLREYRYAAEVDYRPTDGNYYKATLGGDDYVGLERPSRLWGRLNPRRQSDKDMLTLVNLREDAHLICLPFRGAETLEDARAKAAERLRQSDLFKTLSQGAENPTGPQAEPKAVADGKDGDQQLDVQLGSHDRTFLLRVVKLGPDFYLLAGGTRSGRFARLTEDFLRCFDSFKLMPVEN